MIRNKWKNTWFFPLRKRFLLGLRNIAACYNSMIKSSLLHSFFFTSPKIAVKLQECNLIVMKCACRPSIISPLNAISWWTLVDLSWPKNVWYLQSKFAYSPLIYQFVCTYRCRQQFETKVIVECNYTAHWKRERIVVEVRPHHHHHRNYCEVVI